MPEYLGYTGRGESVDFAGEARKLATQISDIEQRRTLEKEELDAMNNLDMKVFQMGNNQTMNSFVLNGASSIRSSMFDWNKRLKSGELSPKDYKNRMTNAKDYWASLAETANGYDERFMKQIERQRSGDASNLEVYGSQQLADLQNLEAKSIYIDDESGRILLYNTDENGLNIGEPIDMNHLNNPNNVISAKIDVADQVVNTVKNWGSFKQFQDLKKGATSTEEGVRLNAAYEQSVAELAYTMMNQTPNAVASIIGDNGVAGVHNINGIDYNLSVDLFSTDKEKDIKKAQQLDKLREQMKISGKTLTSAQETGFLNELDKYMIQVSRDANGTFHTHPTEFHKEIAVDRIKNEVEISLGHSVTGTPHWKKTTSGSGSGDSGKKYLNGYNATINAFASPDGVVSDGLNSNYVYIKKGGKINVYKRLSADGIDLTQKIINSAGKGYPPKSVINNAKQLSVYTFGGSQDAALNKWDQANKVAGRSSSNSSNNAPEGGNVR